MSRCFPFPPPGYERKAEADNVDLLKQDKHKEKKHKKEKKDKEKREGKEKKEKDRSDEKHRDKKEKKDKHRDKKKDKEKEKEKERERDRSSTSNEKKLPVQVGAINEEKPLDRKGPFALPVVQTGEKSIQKEKDKEKNRNNIPDNKRPVTVTGHNVEKVVSTNHVVRDISDAKYVQELDKRVKNDKSTGSQLAEKFAALDQRKDDPMAQFLGKGTVTRLEGKERIKDRRPNEQKIDEPGNREQSRYNGILKVQNSGVTGQTKFQEIVRPSEENAKEIEWRELVKGKEGDDKRGDKLKDKDRDRKSQGKVKDSSREKKDERSKEKAEQKHVDQEKLKASKKNDVLESPHLNSIQIVKDPSKTVASGGNLKKRKESETNGFLHANEIRSSKVQKQVPVSHPPLENGRALETCQTPTQLALHRLESTNNVKVDREERKINGVMGSHASPPSSLPPPLSTVQADLLLSEASSVKPPHPDSKYLSEVLKVPKLEELPVLDDDQGWLFSSPKENLKNSRTGSSVFEGTPEVWGESLHIESADIYALPYVIPY